VRVVRKEKDAREGDEVGEKKKGWVLKGEQKIRVRRMRPSLKYWVVRIKIAIGKCSI
jgi:hypothetical protein